jgi:hypothetical protein
VIVIIQLSPFNFETLNTKSSCIQFHRPGFVKFHRHSTSGYMHHRLINVETNLTSRHEGKKGPFHRRMTRNKHLYLFAWLGGNVTVCAIMRLLLSRIQSIQIHTASPPASYLRTLNEKIQIWCEIRDFRMLTVIKLCCVVVKRDVTGNIYNRTSSRKIQNVVQRNSHNAAHTLPYCGTFSCYGGSTKHKCPLPIQNGREMLFALQYNVGSRLSLCCSPMSLLLFILSTSRDLTENK